MKKLIRGIVEFQKNILPDYRERFAQLALGQKPDALFICCSDSRVAPNVFASTDPGDLFVVRNVGNMIPPCGAEGLALGDESEFAAIEFAILKLNVRNIVVCGHSECGAMGALLTGREQVGPDHLRSWLRHGEPALQQFKIAGKSNPEGTDHDRLSQANVLLQLEHLKTYQLVHDKISRGELDLHAWWFDIKNADVYAYEPQFRKFVRIDETEAERILERIEEDRSSKAK